MQKHKLSSLILLTFLILGCKSVPNGSPVNPLNLLDNNSNIYISVPVKEDPELVLKVLEKNVTNISNSDLNQIIQRLNTVYCGINYSGKETEYQIVADANIPPKYMQTILNAKKGWYTQEYKNNDSSNKYKIFYNNIQTLAFPSSKIVCSGRDITSMLQKYDELFVSEDMFAINDNNSDLSDDLYNWLNNTQDEIRFYANQPKTLLSILTKQQIDLQIFNLSGSLKKDLENPDEYKLNLNFYFADGKFRKAGKTLLKIAFGIKEEQTVSIGDAGLQINGIRIQKEQLYNNLVL